MKSAVFIGFLAISAAPGGATAFELSLPLGAVETGANLLPNSEFNLPVAPFLDGKVQGQAVSGQITERAWRFPIGSANLGDFAAQLRTDLADDGYDILLDCAEDRCGGFDFRYKLDLLPEPKMHVDLGDYRFISATKGDGANGADYAQIVLSRSPGSGYLQVTTISKLDGTALIAATKSPNFAALANAQNATVIEMLEADGFATLDDLAFQVGSSNLDDRIFQSLADLSDFMVANPDVTIALVGHTDAQGTLDNNLRLSRARANSVRAKLINEFGVPGNRLEAAGVGYLSPRAPNQTDEGRTKNRRVEVIITSTRP